MYTHCQLPLYTHRIGWKVWSWLSIFSQNERSGLHNILSSSEPVSDMSSYRQFYRLAVPTGSAPLVLVLEIDPLCPHYWHFMTLRSGVARPFSSLQAWEKTDIISSMPEVTKRNKDNYFLQSLLCASLHAHIISFNSTIIFEG